VIDTFSSAALALCEAGRVLHAQGWVPATSGNFSARVDDQSMAITVSGRHKGRLEADDIMRADFQGRPLTEGKRSSAETLLHAMLYARDPAIGAVLHTHSVNATLLSRGREGELMLEDYELLKAFAGVETHATRLVVPIFANDQDIDRLATKVATYFTQHPPVHGYLIAGHGLYTWGRDIPETLRHIEAFEFLFACELQQARAYPQ